jgi:nucleoside recognition membrane protein YjiH
MFCTMGKSQIFVKDIALKQYQNRIYQFGKLLGAALEPFVGACGLRGLVFEVPALGPKNMFLNQEQSRVDQQELNKWNMVTASNQKLFKSTLLVVVVEDTFVVVDVVVVVVVVVVLAVVVVVVLAGIAVDVVVD